MPAVSVIMGVYNQLNRDELYLAVESIINQTYEDFEFIIYNDGSLTEGSDLLQEVSELDDRIILIGNNINQGLATSLNACIKIAKGKYIARMDADDICASNRFERQVAFLEDNPDVSWVGTNVSLIDDSGKWGKRVFPEHPDKQDFLKFSPYAHPSVMYRAEVFHSNQGYLENEEMLRCEDYEIFMRFHKAGLKGANLQEELLSYRESRNSYNKRTFRSRINEMKCRYRNFKELKLMWPVGWIYVLRPIVASLIPSRVIALIKHCEAK